MDIINTDSRKQGREKYSESEAWKNYAVRAQRNPELKRYMFDKYNGICQWCGQKLSGMWVLQHTTYDHECTSERKRWFYTPTATRPNHKRYLPDCMKCEHFDECVGKYLAPVHSRCNRELSKETFKLRRAEYNAGGR